MFFISGDEAASFLSSWSRGIFPHHFLFGVDPLAPISWWLLENYLVDSLEDVRFESGSTICLDAYTTSFLSSAYSGLTRDPKLCEEISPLLCSHSRNTRHGFAFAVGVPPFELVFWLLFDMAFCFPLGSGSSERKLLKWQQKIIEKLIILNKHRR